MPELPEVETIARTLRPQILGQRIVACTVPHSKVIQAGKELLCRLRGGRIDTVSRRAKLLLMGVCQPEKLSPPDDILYLVFHLKMTGSFFVYPPGTPPRKHTRLILDLADENRLFFDDTRGFGYCRAISAPDLTHWPFWASLGPEPLDMSEEDLAAHLQSIFAKRRATVKSLLLDQRVLAGIGNIYADESLFRAGIRPDAHASALAPARVPALATALREILRRAIRECGSSIRDYRDANGKAGAFQNSFAVYGRKGKPCIQCGGPLEAGRIAGRGTVFCPVCQRAGACSVSR